MEHNKEIHNWCNFCYSSFISQKKLKKHIIAKHTLLTGLIHGSVVATEDTAGRDTDQDTEN